MKNTSRRRAFTLVELAIAMSLSVIVLASVSMVVLSTARSFNAGAAGSELSGRARRTVERIVDEMRMADVAVLDAVDVGPLSDDALDFDQAASVREDTGIITWRPMRIEMRYDPGELDDGIDNDGDELVDECEVVLIRNWNTPEEQQVTLVRWVRELLEGEIQNGLDDNGNGLIDESGLCFDREGDTLNIRLTLERRDPEGRLMTYSVESSTWIRN